MSLLFTIAPRFLSQGTFGPFASSNAAFTQNGYAITFTNSSDWPTTSDVATVTIEVSLDNGATWQFDASLTLGPGPWKNRQGQTVNTAGWTVSSPPAGTTNIRATLQMLQGATLGISASTL